MLLKYRLVRENIERQRRTVNRSLAEISSALILMIGGAINLPQKVKHMSDAKHKESHGKQWLWLMILGLLLIAAGTFLIHSHGWLLAILLGIGGLLVVFSASEMMIIAVDAYAKRKKINSFVAGTMAGLSSNIPELVMLAFILMATPRVGFIVTVLTLHVGAAAFGLYCGILPRDIEGNAHLPKPLVNLSTDLYAAAAGVFFSLGVIMMLMKAFSPGSGVGTVGGRMAANLKQQLRKQQGAGNKN